MLKTEDRDQFVASQKTEIEGLQKFDVMDIEHISSLPQGPFGVTAGNASQMAFFSNTNPVFASMEENRHLEGATGKRTPR